MKRGRWIAAGMAFMLGVGAAGCGTAGSGSIRPIATGSTARGTSTPIPPSATATRDTTTTSGAVAAPCRSSQLRLVLGRKVSEATQQNTLMLVMRNSSTVTCKLRGYPRIVLLDGHGSTLPFDYRDHGDQMLTGSPPTDVVLISGAEAFFAINKNACIAFSNRLSKEISVTPPGQAGSLQVKLHRYPMMSYCPAGDAGHTVDVSPVEATLSGVFAVH